jgi:hypothetical protein
MKFVEFTLECVIVLPTLIWFILMLIYPLICYLLRKKNFKISTFAPFSSFVNSIFSFEMYRILKDNQVELDRPEFKRSSEFGDDNDQSKQESVLKNQTTRIKFKLDYVLADGVGQSKYTFGGNNQNYVMYQESSNISYFTEKIDHFGFLHFFLTRAH